METVREVTADQVESFAIATGDRNPIHFGPDAIVPGALLLGCVGPAVISYFGEGVMITRCIAHFRGAVKVGQQFWIVLDESSINQASFVCDSGFVDITARIEVMGRKRRVSVGELMLLLHQSQVLTRGVAA